MRDRLDNSTHRINGLIKIRAMVIQDYEAVKKLWQSTEGIVLRESDSEESIHRYLKRNPGLSLVAETEDKYLVGAVLNGHDGARGCIRHLTVKREYRSQGLGGKLVRRCLELLGDEKICKCTIFVKTDNDIGLEFWIKENWELRTDLRALSKVIP